MSEPVTHADLPKPDTVHVEPFKGEHPLPDGWCIHTFVQDGKPSPHPLRAVHMEQGGVTALLIQGEALIVAAPQIGLAYKIDEETGRVTVRATV